MRVFLFSSVLACSLPDGCTCVIALPNKLVEMTVTFKVLYGIRQKTLMSIIFSLKNYSIYMPRDIIWLLVLKITELRSA